jgi:FkbM family methyltransferase
METKIFPASVNGFDLSFHDLSTSVTVAIVADELRRDAYGLEKIAINPEDVVIDVGANIGIFSIYVRKKFGCRVICFEPVPLNFENLKKNILLNGLELEDFELHDCAITSTEGGQIQISTPSHNSGGSSAFVNGSASSICRTERLGKYITKDCLYIKIDTEGGEYEIIPDILKDIKDVAFIGVEYHKLNSSQDPDALHSLLKKKFKGRIFFMQ